MKTSNKILLAAGSAFLLVIVTTSVQLIRKTAEPRRYARELCATLAKTPIRTLIVENSISPGVWRENYRPWLEIDSPVLSREVVFVRGDTLFLRNAGEVSLRLPHLETYVEDGVEKPLPNE